jgi:hypothetical protein
VDCTLLDVVQEGLVAALAQLPELDQLWSCWVKSKGAFSFPIRVLQQLPLLTSLKLAGSQLWGGNDQAICDLKPLQALTRLVELDLTGFSNLSVTADALSGICNLTCLKLAGLETGVEPGALAGRTRLQHLDLSSCSIVGGAPGVAELLSQLLQMQELTHLTVGRSMGAVVGDEQDDAWMDDFEDDDFDDEDD